MPEKRPWLAEYLPKLDISKMTPEMVAVHGYLTQIAAFLDQVIDRDIEDVRLMNEELATQLNEGVALMASLKDQCDEESKKALDAAITELEKRLDKDYLKAREAPKEGKDLAQLIISYIKVHPWLFLVAMLLIIVLLPGIHKLALAILAGLANKHLGVDFYELAPWFFGGP